MTDLVLGLDLGTGSVKAVLYDADGLNPVAQAAAPNAVATPQITWAESDPNDWERSVAAVSAQVLHQAPPGRLRAIGLSGQMHGVVLCDPAGNRTRPAVLWADGRATDAVSAYAALGPEALERLANPVVPGMAGPILHWLWCHEPDTVSAASWALQPKDWLRLRLTGEVGTEPSDASATLLWDVRQDSWDLPILQQLGIRRELLPSPCRSADVAGGTTGRLGLPTGVPVAFGGADTACAAYGAGLAKPGMAQLSTGTGGQIVVTLDRPVADPTRRSHLFRAVHDGGWYAMAALQNVGLALERAWRLLGVTWSEAYELAATAPPGSAAVTFVPHLSGERAPYLDTTLRGGWLGLGLGTERHHLVRATFEGVAFGLRQALDTLREAGHVPPALALAGGGSQHPFWRQMLADILGVRLIAHAHPAASARGAAALAAQAVGLIAEPPQPESTKADDITEPTNADCYAEAYDAFRRRSPLR